MDSSDRIEKILAMMLLNQLGNLSQRDKAIQLSLVGFSNAEIADLLQTKAGVIAQGLYEVRKGASKKKTKSRK
ncbi:MAG TPA: hypothetical protein VGT99_08520 [Gammaproteobacteria bacterium]|nr:hypothetical protein [Gammaproteobacteria bacterium]